MIMVYDPNNKPTNRYARVYQGFLEQAKDHVLTVWRDDGLNRHMRVGSPDSNHWSWNVITWPGYLSTVGDIADGYTFRRTSDMIAFFDLGSRSLDYYEDGSPSIDFRYWAEKLTGGRAIEVKKYSDDVFLESVRDMLEEHEHFGTEAQDEYEKIVEVAKRVCSRNDVDFEEYAEATRKGGYGGSLAIDGDNDDELEFFGMKIPEHIPKVRREEIVEEAKRHSESEHEAQQWLQEEQEIFGSDAYYECDLRDYDIHFLFTCYALALTVRLWREYEASPAAKAHRNPGDSYVLLEGGLVTNSPALPVFDLDVLSSDVPDAESAREALELYESIAKHPTARVDLSGDLVKLAEFVIDHGHSEEIEKIEALEAARLAENTKES